VRAVQTISLYVPCYNAERYLASCIEGILAQTRPADEVIIVDDGSSDNSVGIASKFPVKIVRHEMNRGLSTARNTGIQSSNCDLVASLDADCVASPQWLETLAAHLEDDSISGAGGRLIERYRVKLPDLWRSLHMRQHWGDNAIVNPMFLFGNNNIFRKSALLEAGLYNPKLRTNHEDVAMSEMLYALGHSLVYEPRSLVEHLRTDTTWTVIAGQWRWRFFGYRDDITIVNTMKHTVKHLTQELPDFLREDLRTGSVKAAAFTCLGIAYSVTADWGYVLKHHGETKLGV
jgi:glycosyltransferase involved in cell wall biosynthesis